MIVDPWGKIIAELPNGEGIITSKLNLPHLQHIRASLPTLQHKV
jgi:nitrilase